VTYDTRGYLLLFAVFVAAIMDSLFARSGFIFLATLVAAVAVGRSELGISAEERRRWGR